MSNEQEKAEPDGTTVPSARAPTETFSSRTPDSALTQDPGAGATTNYKKRTRRRRGNVGAATFGAVVFVAGLYLTLHIPCPSPSEDFAQRMTWCLAGGLIAAAFFGEITLKLAFGASLAISAVGGAAVFTLVFTRNPAANFGNNEKCKAEKISNCQTYSECLQECATGECRWACAAHVNLARDNRSWTGSVDCVFPEREGCDLFRTRTCAVYCACIRNVCPPGEGGLGCRNGCNGEKNLVIQHAPTCWMDPDKVLDWKTGDVKCGC